MKEREMSSRASSLLRKASGGFDPSAVDRTRTRAAIARRIVVGVAAGAAVAAGAKSAAAAPSLAPAALAPSLAPAALAPAVALAPTAAAPLAAGAAAGIGFATKFVAAVAIIGTVSAGAVTVRHVSRETNSRETNSRATNSSATNSSATSQTVSQAIAQTAPANPRGANPVAANPMAAAPVQAPIENNDVASETIAANDLPIAPAPIANTPQIPAQSGSQNSQAAKPEASASTKPALQTGAEAELLQRAQQALTAEDAPRALALLNEHAQRFPNGSLSEERDAARVLALCGAGRQSEAAKMGAAFLSAHPDSPLASRVRSSCANGGANSDAPVQ
jgi:hypothetical protein